MELTLVFVLAGLLAAACGRVDGDNSVWGQDLAVVGPESGPELYDSSGGAEKLSVEVVAVEGNGVEEEEEEGMKGAAQSEVDEETIRRAEKMADKDLLNGLNRILKNNETLKDVFKAEDVYPIS